MASRRIVLLVNPAAGHGRARRAGPDVAARLRAHGYDVDTVTGSSRADAEDRLDAAFRSPALAAVACGGDGTVNQLLQRVVGTEVGFGVVPTGTGNDAASALGLPGDPASAVEDLVRRLAEPPTLVDTAEAVAADGTRRVYLAVLSSGFDSLVNERANRMTWPTGRARYLRAVLAELRVFRPVPYQLLLDEGRPGERHVDRPGMLVAVGNGSSYGGGMRVCPTASLADGLLSTTFLTELPTRTFLRVFPSVFRGTHVRRPEVLTDTAATVRVSAPGQVAYADGERLGPLPVTVRALPRSLRALAPPPPPEGYPAADPVVTEDRHVD